MAEKRASIGAPEARAPPPSSRNAGVRSDGYENLTYVHCEYCNAKFSTVAMGFHVKRCKARPADAEAAVPAPATDATPQQKEETPWWAPASSPAATPGEGDGWGTFVENVAATARKLTKQISVPAIISAPAMAWPWEAPSAAPSSAAAAVS